MINFAEPKPKVAKELSGEKRLMLRILKDALINQFNFGWINSVDIPRLGGPWRYTDTIMKLRREGYKIESRRVEGKAYCQYRLGIGNL